MKNKYSLLNYDWDTHTETLDFTTTEHMIDAIINKLAKVILKNKEDKTNTLDLPANDKLVSMFYRNYHFGSIQDRPELTGNVEVDKAIAFAVESLEILQKTTIASEAGIGDTATDEDIAYELGRLIKL